MKIALGIVLGIVMAGITIFAVEWIGSRLFADAAGAAMRGDLSGVPTGALALVVLGWALGTAVGGMVAVRTPQRGWTAWLVAGFVVSGVIANATMIPHPLWITASGVLLPLLAALIISRSAPARTGAAASEV